MGIKFFCDVMPCVGWVSGDVSNEHSAIIFSVRQCTNKVSSRDSLRLQHFCRNVTNRSPTRTTLHPRWPQYSLLSQRRFSLCVQTTVLTSVYRADKQKPYLALSSRRRQYMVVVSIVSVLVVPGFKEHLGRRLLRSVNWTVMSHPLYFTLWYLAPWQR